MPSKIENAYTIHVESYMSDIKEEQNIFPEDSSFSAYSYAGNKNIENLQLFWGLGKNRSEIPLNLYRNGIVSNSDLESKVINNKIFLHSSEYMAQGEYRNVISEGYINIATSTQSETVLNLNIFDLGTRSEINFLSTGIYKRKRKSYELMGSPKDMFAIPYSESSTFFSYFGYIWDPNEEPEDSFKSLIVTNYLNNFDDIKSSLKADGFDISTLDFDSESLLLLCEELGTANGTYNQVFKTKYFPISERSTLGSLDISDGRTKIFTLNNNIVTSWQLANSYAEAVTEAENSEDGYCCYLDRWNGKFHFVKSNALETGFKETGNLVYNGFAATDFQKISDGGIDEFKFTIAEALAEQLLDTGFLQIKIEQYVPDPPVIETVSYRRLNKTTFIVRDYEAGWHGSIPIKIKPIIGNMTPPVGKVYAYYTPVIDFCLELNNNKRKPISEELRPWTWQEQKAIAVLGSSKDIPYKITLKAIDIPFASQRGSTTAYGPIYSGSEVVLLEGLVETEEGIPVVNQEVELVVSDGFGNFAGQNPGTVITDTEGKFYSSYNPLSSRDNWLYFIESDIVRIGNGLTKLFINNNYNNEKISSIVRNEDQEVIVYSILTNDGSMGTYGRTKAIDSSEVVDTALEDKYGQIISIEETRLDKLGKQAIIVYDFINNEDIETYSEGKIVLKAYFVGMPSNSEPTYMTLKIKDIALYPEAWKNSETNEYEFIEQRHRLNTYAIVIDSPSLISNVAYFTTVSLIAKTEKEFDPYKLNKGKKVALAEIKDSSWMHPSIEGRSPVYGPVMTASYDAGSKVFYVNSLLPESNIADREKNIAGYALIPKVKNIIFARTKGEDLDYIKSNNIEFNIELDRKDVGVVKDILDTIKIPFGFRLADINDDSSSTIGINTFLTMNHVPGMSLGVGENAFKYPTVSALGPDGIIYLGNSTYTASSNGLKFKLVSVGD